MPVYTNGQEGLINILYTGGIKGELEPCGCSPKTESGGLARLSGYISGSGQRLKPYILIDAGNSMGGDTPQGRLKAEALLRSFEIMGYDSVAFLKQEAAFPEDFLSPLIGKYGTPAISKEGRVRSASIERGPVKINISADAGERMKGRLNILLTDRPVSEVKELKGWEVIITSSGEILEEPLKANGAVIVSGYPQGKKLGVLTLEFGPNGVSKSAHRWQALGKEIKEDPGVRGVLNEYDSMVAALLKDEDRKAAEDGPYLGAARCVECHKPFIESWEKTRHSGAFNSLEKAGKSKDPECVKCHTVGFAEEGGFYSMGTTPGLKNVQCEACHGPGRDHVLDLNAPLMPVTETVCLKCHTQSNSPEFDFKLYFEKIKHR